MASPQREHGHLDVANELSEALAFAPLSGTQFRLLWVLLRKTYGWQKTQDVIAASQFSEATGLHRKVVERELRDLARRRYILAWGDTHHPKTYAIQKDYSQWDEGEVGTKMLPLRAKSGNKSVPKWEQIGTKVGTDRFPTITTTQIPPTQIPEETEPHGSGTLRDRFEVKYREAKNKPAVLGELFSLLLGQTANIGRVGGMSKRLNSGGNLMDLIIEASKQRISDDPHDYLEAMVRREVAKKGGGNETDGRRNHGANHRSAYAAQRLAVGAAGSHGGGGTDSWADADPPAQPGR